MSTARASTPHPFALILVAALGLALVAAALAPDRAPAFALYWNPIYRAEIVLAVLAFVYLLAVAGWMAWKGQAFRRIELPGGTVLERDAAEIDSAATDFDGFRESAAERLDALEAGMAGVNDRIDRIEGGSDFPIPRGTIRMRWVPPQTARARATRFASTSLGLARCAKT